MSHTSVGHEGSSDLRRVSNRASRALVSWFLVAATLLFANLLSRSEASSALAQSAQSSQPQPDAIANRPIVVAYYYKIKWGHQDEFLELYRKNHYPVLEEQIKSGRLLSVEAYTPRFHGDGCASWNLVTILVFKNWQALGDNRMEAEIIKKLYPDQERFRKEEQRRFQLLDGHWDVPLTPTKLK